MNDMRLRLYDRIAIYIAMAPTIFYLFGATKHFIHLSIAHNVSPKYRLCFGCRLLAHSVSECRVYVCRLNESSSLLLWLSLVRLLYGQLLRTNRMLCIQMDMHDKRN